MTTFTSHTVKCMRNISIEMREGVGEKPTAREQYMLHVLLKQLNHSQLLHPSNMCMPSVLFLTLVV